MLATGVPQDLRSGKRMGGPLALFVPLAVVQAVILGPISTTPAHATTLRPAAPLLPDTALLRVLPTTDEVIVPTPRPQREGEIAGTPEENCGKNDGDARIDGCTKLIDAGGLDDSQLASVLTARGYGYLLKREYNLAILDFNRSLELVPDEVQVHVYRGYAFGLVEDHKNAVSDFTRALELDPENAGIHADRGSAHNAAGNAEEALKDFERAIALAPDAEFPYSGRAAVYAGLGEDELALADYSKALEITPKHWTNRRERGNLLLQTGRYKEAIEDYSAAIGIWPTDAVSMRDRAIAKSMLGQYAAAIRDLDTAIKTAPKRRSLYRTRAAVHERLQSYDPALADFDQALSLYENDVEAMAGRARLLALKGDFEDALTAIGKLLEAVPDRADAYLVRALIHGRTGQPDAALQDILVGFGLDPQSTAIAVAGAGVLTEIGDPLGALAVLEPILKDNPEHEPALVNRAAAFAASGETEAALADCRAAIALRPSVEAYLVMAEIHKGAGDSYRAVRAIRELKEFNAGHARAKLLIEAIIDEATAALASNPDDAAAKLGRSFARLSLNPKERPVLEEIYADILSVGQKQPDNALAYLAMAMLKQQVGRKDLAITDLQRATQLDPNLADAHVQIGVIHTGGTTYWLAFLPFAEAARLDPALRDKAMRWIEQMMVPATMTTRHQPDNVDLLLGLAVGNTMLGDFDKAYPYFDKAIELKPDMAEIHYQRGLAYQASGKRDQAIMDLEKAAELNPGDSRIEGTLKALQNDG